MELATYRREQLTVGAKETYKALMHKRLAKVYIANNCDAPKIESIVALCEEQNIPLVNTHTMEELGKAAHIKVKAVAVGVLR